MHYESFILSVLALTNLSLQVLLSRYLRKETLACYDLATYDEFVEHLDDHLRKGVTLCTPYIFSMKAGNSFPMSIEDFEQLRMKDSAGAICVHIAGSVL